MTIMDIEYVYCKSRHEFGRACSFEFDGPIAVENIEPDLELRREFIARDPCHIASQKSQQYAVHEAQTENIKLTESGMFHCEGGWPREINFKVEEATAKFRKRIIKGEDWATKMKNLMTPMEYYVKQNNAVNIYENYFDEMIPSKLVLPLEARTVNIYADPQRNARPITNISWSPRGGRMIVTHSSMDFTTSPFTLSPLSYLWSIENPVHPLLALKPESPSAAIEFSPQHSSLLVSGQMTGQVALWDLRKSVSPISESQRLYSHSDPARIVLWINTPTHCEFASASSDGLMKLWDMRKMREPTQTLAMNLSHAKEAETILSLGISSMNYTSGTGSKFMAGLENGIVVNGSLKAKTDREKLGVRFECHIGPVISVYRNPLIPKIFMTVGDWTSRIWAEDVKESCLASTEYGSNRDMLTGGCWSASRVSVFYSIGYKGEFKVWDLLAGLNKPVEMLKLGKNPLTRIKTHKNGKFIAVGNRIGKVYLIESSEALGMSKKNDKALLTAYLENCGHYEKCVDNRLREMKHMQRFKDLESKVSLDVTSKANREANKKQLNMDNGERKVGTKVNQTVNERIGFKVEKTTPVPLDLDLIEPEKEYFAVVHEELLKHQKLEREDHHRGDHRRHDHHHDHHHHAHESHESKTKGHRRRVKHEHKSYRNKDAHTKYEKPVKYTEENIASPAFHSDVEFPNNEELLKPKVISPRLVKRRRKSWPRLCAAGNPPEICRPEVCCRDAVNDSSNKGMKLTIKKQDSLKQTEDNSLRKTRLSISPEKAVATLPATTAALELDNSEISRFEKYHDASLADVKEYSIEDKAEILKRATARPSTILLEVLLAKKRIDQEAERLRSGKKDGISDGNVDEVETFAKSVPQVTEAQGKIDLADNVTDRSAGDVEPGSSPKVKPVQVVKMKQQILSPKEIPSGVLPRKALTGLQVMRTEVFKPLPKLTERRKSFSPQKDSFEDRLCPTSSDFPPLPRIILPKLLERPPDPTFVGSDKGGKSMKVKRKVKSSSNKAEKSRSPNN